MVRVLVLGGYGAVGESVSRRLVDLGVHVTVGGRRYEFAQRLADQLNNARPVTVDATMPEAVRAAAEPVEAVVNCSGQESVELVEAVVAGGAHMIDVSADYRYQRAVAQSASAVRETGREVLFSVGLTPGLTDLLAAKVAADFPSEPVELVVVLGAAEDHGRAAREWLYGLLGRDFADTGRRVRNFTGHQWRQVPRLGQCLVYRVDLSDQHVLSADLDRPVTTRLGTDSQLITAFLAALGRLPGWHMPPRLGRARRHGPPPPLARLPGRHTSRVRADRVRPH